MSRSEGLAAIGPYFAEMLADLSPARKKAVSRKIGLQLRRSNVARIAANIEPDGSAMEKRKPRRERVRDRAKAKMFRKLRYARNFKVKPSADGVELAPIGKVAKIAGIHHFGLDGYVGTTPDGRSIRARYAERKLLGFGNGDIDEMTDELLAWLDRDR